MITKNIQSFKQLTYVGLLLTSFILASGDQTLSMEGKGDEDQINTQRRIRSRYRETHNAMAKKYDMLEHVLPDASQKRKVRDQDHEESQRSTKHHKLDDEPTLLEELWNVGEAAGESFKALTNNTDEPDKFINFADRFIDRGASLIKNEHMRKMFMETKDDFKKTFFK
ncbi:MAG TPA: hypothetical protein VMW10_02895 [Alphaproteobacteria bacterium]|nr:hypothetical protein [Alphaproteobacteria bacterium]